LLRLTTGILYAQGVKANALLDSDNLPDPDLIAAEIADDLRSALEQMEAILADLEPAAPWAERAHHLQ
jgi:glycosyltransferase involved in cell wall biosynthesis